MTFSWEKQFSTVIVAEKVESRNWWRFQGRTPVVTHFGLDA